VVLIFLQKNEFKLDETDDLVILCPVPDGKMVKQIYYTQYFNPNN